MATVTDTEAALLVLKKIGERSSSGNGSGSDLTDTLTVFQSRMEMLRDDELVYWQADSVPQAVLDPLAEYMTLYVAPLFMDEQEALQYAARSEKGLADMRRALAKRSRGRPVKAEYF